MMLASRIVGQSLSTEKAPRCTIASTPRVILSMSFRLATSPRANFSFCESLPTGLMSESRNR